MNKTGVASAAMACLLAATQAQAQAPAASAADKETLLRIRDAAMGTDYAYQRLTDLTDLVGPRLSGSPGAAAAVDMVSAEMKKIGMQVTLQPVKAPHWVRGAETAELVDYQGRPAGITQKLVLTALGGSSATPAAGITAPVLLAHDMDDLNAHKDQVKGAIVVFDAPFDEQLAQAGRAGNAYGEAGKYRFVGPAAASKLGAAAALVRSVGGANYRVPHTGMTGWGDGVKPIPAGALTAEDVMLIDRLYAHGPVKMHLTLTPQTLPDVDSADVLADIPGSDKADELVLIS
ncbi:MAG TPA: peptidase M28, partial [Burkholderiaceae bacterium]